MSVRCVVSWSGSRARSRSAGNIKATIWKNEGLNRAFYSTTFSRPYKNAEGKWHNAYNFGLYELESLMKATMKGRPRTVLPITRVETRGLALSSAVK